MCRCLIFKDTNSAHHIMATDRTLYVGNDLALLHLLNRELIDCLTVRCARGNVARMFLESNIKYSLLLFDEELPDMRGAELAQLAREFPHREHTPLMILSEGFDVGSIVETITDRLQDSENLGLRFNSYID
jgi:DNA-binding response OmpR family regulator